MVHSSVTSRHLFIFDFLTVFILLNHLLLEAPIPNLILKILQFAIHSGYLSVCRSCLIYLSVIDEPFWRLWEVIVDGQSRDYSQHSGQKLEYNRVLGDQLESERTSNQS